MRSRGEKAYDSPERAARYARAFDREDRSDVGRRPLLSLLPVALMTYRAGALRQLRTDRLGLHLLRGAFGMLAGFSAFMPL